MTTDVVDEDPDAGSVDVTDAVLQPENISSRHISVYCHRFRSHTILKVSPCI